MRIIKEKTIYNFAKSHADAFEPLKEWIHTVRKAQWDNFAEMKQSFNSVDNVGNHRYVFNIKGNDYRIVAIVQFIPKRVFIRFIGTHAEYDKIQDCSTL